MVSMIAPCASEWFAHCFMHKPAFESAVFDCLPFSLCLYLPGDGNIRNLEFQALPVTECHLFTFCGTDNQFESCSTIHKAAIAPGFLNKAFEGNDICRMCYSGEFSEYKIITCNYGNFCKGNHLNLFPLRDRTAFLTALNLFRRLMPCAFITLNGHYSFSLRLKLPF